MVADDISLEKWFDASLIYYNYKLIEEYKEFMSILINRIEHPCYKAEQYEKIKIRILTSYAVFF